MTSSGDDIPQVDERVLSTLNLDGSRRWLRPRVSAGVFLRWRRIIAYLLILIFTLIPYGRINDKPMILLNIARREFTFFGATFLPTDTLLLALLVLSIFVVIFLLTALFGRVWCGWACPQTVYMEFIYRPIERLFEGPNYRSGGRVPVPPVRRIAKYAVYLVVSMFLAHTFLAYFVGVETLFRWVRSSPVEHPTAFLVMAVTTGLMMFDFCYFREQVCTLMCPYGRFQSVLLDRQSLIISYDEKRGEPRGKLTRKGKDPAEPTTAAAPSTGDCIDCHLCVVTCPTGIDIREGLQMECVGCAQCIDACDAVMDRISRPRGLIRYSSQDAMTSGRRRLLRPRVVIYPLVLAIVLSLFGLTLSQRSDADIVFPRTRATPYTILDSGEISSTVQIKITNRTDDPHTYDVAAIGGALLTSPDLPVVVGAGLSTTATLHVTLPRNRFERGRAPLTLRVTNDDGFTRDFDRQVLGPLFGGSEAAQAQEEAENPGASREEPTGAGS